MKKEINGCLSLEGASSILVNPNSMPLTLYTIRQCSARADFRSIALSDNSALAKLPNFVVVQYLLSIWAPFMIRTSPGTVLQAQLFRFKPEHDSTNEAFTLTVSPRVGRIAAVQVSNTSYDIWRICTETVDTYEVEGLFKLVVSKKVGVNSSLWNGPPRNYW